MERELDEVKYSVRRSLCMEVGNQLGKHWAKVTYEDLSDPRLNLPAEKLDSLKAIFGSLYSADLETHELYIEAEKPSVFKYPDDKYNSIEEFLINEMVYDECKLDDAKLLELSEKYYIDFWSLKKRYHKQNQNYIKDCMIV